MARSAWGDAVGTFSFEGRPLCFLYSSPQLGNAPQGAPSDPFERDDEVRQVRLRSVRTAIEDLDAPPADVADAYLRLHLLSHRLVRPNEVSLEGIFGILPNVCWTSLGPVEPVNVGDVRERALRNGTYVVVRSLDKFPPMLDFVVPAGVRVADAARVRLGAHLAEGTTVMHEGFVNFNAGTLGHSMIEGRIAQGVVVGNGSDVGGGASLMGTLSGGGKERVYMGERSLLGANAGTGIALGDGCTVEAGLYVMPGTVVTLPDGTTCKARELSGKSGLLFRRNSITGAVEVLARDAAGWQGLNSQLHQKQ
ncbi:MAG TPA: DapH/DapD/GlmU-related protein [Acidimicrobiales bacterium]|nr:DapH/DapD/GlmU-related protein [Acidimicrobiales bacterium]